jgi:hypothetical protein
MRWSPSTMGTPPFIGCVLFGLLLLLGNGIGVHGILYEVEPLPGGPSDPAAQYVRAEDDYVDHIVNGNFSKGFDSWDDQQYGTNGGVGYGSVVGWDSHTDRDGVTRDNVVRIQVKDSTAGYSYIWQWVPSDEQLLRTAIFSVDVCPDAEHGSSRAGAVLPALIFYGDDREILGTFRSTFGGAGLYDGSSTWYVVDESPRADSNQWMSVSYSVDTIMDQLSSVCRADVAEVRVLVEAYSDDDELVTAYFDNVRFHSLPAGPDGSNVTDPMDLGGSNGADDEPGEPVILRVGPVLDRDGTPIVGAEVSVITHDRVIANDTGPDGWTQLVLPASVRNHTVSVLIEKDGFSPRMLEADVYDSDDLAVSPAPLDTEPPPPRAPVLCMWTWLILVLVVLAVVLGVVYGWVRLRAEQPPSAAPSSVPKAEIDEDLLL